MSPAGQSRRWLVLGICCLSLFIVGLDVSGLNLALPSIRAGLGLSPSQLQWVLDAYTLVLASLLMLSGSVADRFGRKPMFQLGLVIFGVGSVLCAFSTSGAMLIGSRTVQAVGGSMLNPVAMSIVTNVFPDPRERAQAIGVWGAAYGLSMALGPLIGGLLVQGIGWEAIFWLNVPVVLVALVLTGRYVPNSKAAQPRRLDPVGQLIVIVALAALVYAIIEGRVAGWAAPQILGAFGLAAVSAIIFVAVERRITEPLVDPRFFTSIPFTGACVAAVLGFAGMVGFLFVNTLYLQSDRGLSPIQAGLMTAPMAVCSALMAPISGRITGTRGPQLPMMVSGVLITAAALLLTGLRTQTSTAALIGTYAVFGCGFGLLNAPITNTAVSGMPRAQAGVAAAISSTSRQVGSALGVALFGTLTFGGLSGSNITGLAAASHPAWWTLAGCGVGLLAVGYAVSTPAAKRSGERVRRLMDIEA